MQVCRLSLLYQHITYILLGHQNWTYIQLGCPRNQRTHLVYFFRMLPKFSVITDFQYRIMWQRIVPGRDTKIRTFSGPFWHFGPDPDQILNSGPLRLAIQDFDSWTFLGSNGKIKFSTQKMHVFWTIFGSFSELWPHFLFKLSISHSHQTLKSYWIPLAICCFSWLPQDTQSGVSLHFSLSMTISCFSGLPLKKLHNNQNQNFHFSILNSGPCWGGVAVPRPMKILALPRLSWPRVTKRAGGGLTFGKNSQKIQFVFWDGSPYCKHCLICDNSAYSGRGE